MITTRVAASAAVFGAVALGIALCSCGPKTSPKSTPSTTAASFTPTSMNAPPPHGTPPALPTPDLSGTYTFTDTIPQPGSPFTWIVTSCGPRCLNLLLPSGARRQYHFINGRWESNVWTGGARCDADGSKVPTDFVSYVNAEFTTATNQPIKVNGRCANGDTLDLARLRPDYGTLRRS
jgi:hypothetical protein